MDQDLLKKSILQTLAWFDVFDYPLTGEELYRNLWGVNCIYGLDYTDFLFLIGEFLSEGLFCQEGGYYFLFGREKIIEKREESVLHMEKKLKIAKKGAKKIRWVPFVRAMFVCNTVAGGYTTKDSDVDVFIVVSKNRLWITRFIVTAVFNLFWLRRKKRRVTNKICLSFYVTDNHLDLSDIKLEGDDIYLVYWLSQLVPVYDPEGVRNIIYKKNEWAKKYLLNGFGGYDLLGRYRVDDVVLSRWIKKFFEKMWVGGYGNFLNNQAMTIQKSRMKLNRKSVQNQNNTHVVITDEMLKFHENDRREYYRECWEKLCLAYFNGKL